MQQKIRVTVWNEYLHELSNPKVAAIYPRGIHETIGEFLRKQDDFLVRTAVLREEEHGLTQDVLDNTDVLLWWGHKAHGEVGDQV
ncbi:MAG: trehalose utilization protein ThuA, partial [Firmicutes bacterium]|nr:trehalose utilization protein ThuA [Bacillota bacterium]